MKQWISTLSRGVGIVVGLGMLVLIIAWLSGVFHKKIPPGEVAVATSIQTDRPTDLVHEVVKEYVEEAIGTLKAASRSVVSAKILATIEEITVAAGDRVTAGDVLVRLNGQELAARVLQAKEALAAAEATRTEAQLSFQRTKGLLKSHAVSRQEFDSVQRRLNVANAEEGRAQQAVVEAQILASYTTIVAPKSGRIIDRLAEPGDTARPGVPLLVLYDATSLRLEAPVLEHLAVKLRVEQHLSVYIDSLEKEYEATIDEIVPQADSPSRSFLVKASLPQSGDLYEGMFGRLRIPAGTRRHLCLATPAIDRIGQLEYVEVVLPGNVVERRFIKTGRLGMPGRVEVLSGLQAGERVILIHPIASPSNTESTHSPTDNRISGQQPEIRNPKQN
jgi:RND family efflux transporter MFP subunit